MDTSCSLCLACACNQLLGTTASFVPTRHSILLLCVCEPISLHLSSTSSLHFCMFATTPSPWTITPHHSTDPKMSAVCLFCSRPRQGRQLRQAGPSSAPGTALQRWHTARRNITSCRCTASHFFWICYHSISSLLVTSPSPNACIQSCCCCSPPRQGRQQRQAGRSLAPGTALQRWRTSQRCPKRRQYAA